MAAARSGPGRGGRRSQGMRGGRGGARSRGPTAEPAAARPVRPLGSCLPSAPGLPGRQAEAPAPLWEGVRDVPTHHRPPVSWAPVTPDPRTCGHDSLEAGPGQRDLSPGDAGGRGQGQDSWGRRPPELRLLGGRARRLGTGAPRRPGPGRTRTPAAAAVRVLSLGGAGGHAGAPRPGGESHGGSPGITVTKTPAGLSPGRLGACYQQSPPCLDCLGESGANQSLGLGSSPVWVF